jgi:hypothetical protein
MNTPKIQKETIIQEKSCSYSIEHTTAQKTRDPEKQQPAIDNHALRIWSGSDNHAGHKRLQRSNRTISPYTIGYEKLHAIDACFHRSPDGRNATCSAAFSSHAGLSTGH